MRAAPQTKVNTKRKPLTHEQTTDKEHDEQRQKLG